MSYTVINTRTIKTVTDESLFDLRITFLLIWNILNSFYKIPSLGTCYIYNLSLDTDG